MNEREGIIETNQGNAQSPLPKEEREQSKPLTAQDVEEIVERLLRQRLAQFQILANGRVAQARSEGRAEAERLSGMSEDERRYREAEAARTREDELTRREEELNRRETHAWVVQELVQRGLPRELADAIDCSDAGRSAESVDALERIFRAAVQRSVDERLGRGHSLPRSSGDAPTSLTRRMRLAAGLSEC